MGNKKSHIYNLESDKEKDFPNQSRVYYNSNFGDYLDFEKKTEGKTLISSVEESCQKYANKICLGYRKPSLNQNKEVEFSPEYIYITFKDMWSFATILSKQIEKLNLAPSAKFIKEDGYDEEPGDFKVIGFFARNCIEWIVMDLACQLDSVSSATLYSTLGDDAFLHVNKQTKLSTICISPENINVLIKYQEKFKFKGLQNVIIFDYSQYNNEVENTKIEKFMDNYGIKVYYFTKLIQTPEKELENIKTTISNPETVLTICYTSGTTNLPKGVKLSQKNFGTLYKILEDADIEVYEADTHFSYLPLAHALERSVSSCALLNGISISFISGEPKKFLAQDIKIAKPSFLLAVPRVLSLFQTMIFENFNKLPTLKRLFVERAFETKRANFLNNGDFTHWFYDKYIFNNVRENFGGKIRILITGSAPLPREVATNIKIFFSIPVIEGYGLTETTIGITITSHLDSNNYNCGGITRFSNLKLEDVPELNYNSRTLDANGNPAPTGEICLKGTTMTSGYFRDKNKTEEAIDKDGWFHTGDIGRLMYEDKGIKIIDRKKEIFKLAQGEYIAPSKLEGAFGVSPYVEQICIHGDPYHTFFVSIIYPNKKRLRSFLASKEMMSENDSLDEVDKHFKSSILQDEMRNEFNKITKEKNFNGLEKVSKMILVSEMFTQQNGLLTDTMKMKRKCFELKFKNEIDEAYQVNK